MQIDRRNALETGLETLDQEHALAVAQYRSCGMDELEDVETRLASYTEELAKAEGRLAL